MAQHLVRAGAGVDAAGLQHHAEAGAQLAGLGDGVEAEDPDRSRVGPAVALACLDRGGLSGAVGAEDGGDAGRGLQIEAVDRGLGSVPLDQTLDPDDGLASHERQV